MFKVFVNDGTQELPDDDIFYIVSKEGVFLKKKMGVMESIAPVKNISILQSVATMARMHINPIPAQWGAKILEFFKEVYATYRGEAIVLLFYNERLGRYKIVPPKQKVTAGSLTYERDVQVPDYQMIGTIHSHGSMSAFHSGVDDDDEKSFDGLHITYGNVMDDECSISASIVANGSRFMIDPQDYMRGLSKTKDIDEKVVNHSTKVYKWINGKMVLDDKATSRTAYTTRKFDKRYVFNVTPSKRRFNAAWMDNVEKGTYTYSYGYGYGYGGYYSKWPEGGGGGSRRWGSAWGSHFDRSAWDQVKRLPPPDSKTKPGISPLNVGPASKTKPAQFPAHEQFDPERPCLSCKHRNCKIMDEFNDVEYEEEMYICEKCKAIITTGEDEPSCPVCKTDEYLVLVDEKDLKDHYEKGAPIPSGNRRPSHADQPNQLGMDSCPQCGSQFLRLEDDESCPFCDTLLPDSPIEDEMEWECPYCSGVFGESEIEIEDHCPHCNGLVELTRQSPFSIPDEEERDTLICPKCQAVNTIARLEVMGTCVGCGAPATGMVDTAAIIEDQMKKDSGTFLDQTEEQHQQILDAAAEADKHLERIPDPEKGQQSTPLTATEKIKDAMKKVFGKKGNDTIH